MDASSKVYVENLMRQVELDFLPDSLVKLTKNQWGRPVSSFLPKLFI